MKRLNNLSLTISAVSLFALYGSAQAACDVAVRTVNNSGATSIVNVSLQAGATQSDSSSFQLPAGASRSDVLMTASESALQLKATVTLGTLSTTCATSLDMCQPMNLMINATTPTTCVTPPPTEDTTCKHDNGNHYGEYKKLGLPVPAPHSGKPNAPCNPKKTTVTKPAAPAPSCPVQPVCSIVPELS